MHEWLFERRVLGSNPTASPGSMVLGPASLEVGGGDVLGTGLAQLPFPEATVGDAAINPEDPHGFVGLNAASIIVVRNFPALVAAAFNAPARAVELQPGGGLEATR